jgi:hypothetical protein
MNAEELARYFHDGLTSLLQKQFNIAKNVKELGRMSQPSVLIEALPVSKALDNMGKAIGTFKGVIVSATQNTSANEDPYLHYFFYVPLDSASMQAELANSSFDKKTGIRVQIVTDLSEKFVTGGQDQFRNTYQVTKDLVAVLSNEDSANFGKKSFQELYNDADAKFSTLYGEAQDTKTVSVTGAMKFLLEVTGQLHLAESGSSGTGTFLSGDYGLFTSHIFKAIESVVSEVDLNAGMTQEEKKTVFVKLADTLGFNSFSSGMSFPNALEDFQKYNLADFILAGRDTTASLFYNPEIENSIFQITEAGAPDPREGFIQDIVQQDQLGSVEKLVASSLLGAKVSDVALKIDQVKKVSNILYSTQAAKKSSAQTSSGLSQIIDAEMRNYLSVFKRITGRTGSIIS